MKLLFFFVPLHPETVKVDSDIINNENKINRKVKGFI